MQAEGIVLSLRDLFQVVFDMKKREMEATKQVYQLDGSLAAGSSRLVRHGVYCLDYAVVYRDMTL